MERQDPAAAAAAGAVLAAGVAGLDSVLSSTVLGAEGHKGRWVHWGSNGGLGGNGVDPDVHTHFGIAPIGTELVGYDGGGGVLAERAWPEITDRRQLLLRLAEAGGRALETELDALDARRDRQRTGLERAARLVNVDELLGDDAWR